MEHSLQIGRWRIRFDPDLTRALYAQVPGIACDCTDCANFRTAGESAFSAPFLHLLGQLGIDPYKPADLAYCGDSGAPMPSAGWFHLVGRIEDGTDAWRKENDATDRLDAEPFPGIQRIGFTSRLAKVPDAFEGHALIQLEFETTVPWVTAIPLA